MDSPLATLCRACGLCCDGNLFAHVPLTADEAARARRHHLVVFDRDDGSPALRQPCAALEEAGCRVYDDRPAPCRRYRCMLLAALADDEVSLRDALAVVTEAHALLAAADAALPAGPGAPLQRARAAAEPPSPHAPAAAGAEPSRAAASADPPGPQARAAVHAARVFLGRHLDRGAAPR
jgi:hypothetical protein